MDSFYIHVLAEDHVVARGDCLSMVLPFDDGLYGIQAHHSNMISAIFPGILSCTMADGSTVRAAVSRGLVKVEDNDVLVLVESAEDPETLDLPRAQRAVKEAQEVLHRQHSLMEQTAAEASLARALNRIRAKRSSDLDNK